MLTFTVTVPVKEDAPADVLAARKLGINRVEECVILKKSVDARRKDNILYNYKLAVKVKNENAFINKDVSYYHMNVRSLEDITKGKKVNCRPVVVGTGPAGLFAALTLAYLGANPVVLERGEDVDNRIKKTRAFIKDLVLDEESNVQFGEGGAGTFSDGKLNTGIKSEYIDTVLREFVLSGAPEEISYLAKPHIGTDKLVEVVKSLRKRIIDLGGEFHFSTKLTDIIIKNGKAVGAVTNEGIFECDEIYLAIGHSAEDTFRMLYEKNVLMESKTYSMGVRIEHLRKDVDFAQYGESAKYLPAADYKLAVKAGDKNLYTFCMCPGGKVINSSSKNGGVCVNGMSYHARDGVNSNSALLINVSKEDWKSEHPLSGLSYRRKYEEKVYSATDSFLPIVQTVGDFLGGKSGGKPAEVIPSVETGYALGDLNDCLPESVAEGIKKGLPLMGRKIRGFDDASAVLTGIEGRSSSPVRIPRDESYQSNIKGLYPIGEGAGYAGGIMSAAVDGIKSVLIPKKITE